MRRSLKPSQFAAAFLIVLIAAVMWAMFDARQYRGRVARNVFVNGVDISKKSPRELERFFDLVEQQLRAEPIQIATFEGGFTASGASFGLTIDRPTLRLAALQARRPDKLTSRIGRYLLSFRNRVDVPIPVLTSPDVTSKSLSELEGQSRRNPLDPQLKVKDGEFTVLPGSDGEGIDGDAIAAELPRIIARGKRPYVLSANRVPLPSRFTNEELNNLVAKAKQLTEQPLVLIAGGRETRIKPGVLRSWVAPKIVDRRLELRLDPEKTMEGLKKALGSDSDRDAVDAKVLIGAAGNIAVTPSAVGVRCCKPDSPGRIQRALAGRDSSAKIPEAITLDLETVYPKRASATVLGWGIKEPIAIFTTKHKPGQDRVKNIHRIADLVRGTVIGPGESFSVNELIGPRTEENGFVKAHAIQDGVIGDQLGGGISQFATTLFNAAFFGGLDIMEYKPHSIYFDRYPYGREATLSFPKPDLRLRNSSPYGVLIWPTYTDSSLTVTLYSTTYGTADTFGDQEVTKQDQCTVVITKRKRVLPDGTEKIDKFRAAYLPKEGVSCDGSPTPGATTTTLLPPPTRATKATTPPVDGGTGPPDTLNTRGTKAPADSRPANTKPKVQAGDGGGAVETPTRVPAGDGTKPPATAEVVRPRKTEAPSENQDPPPGPTPDPGNGGAVTVGPPVTGVE